MFQDHVLGHLWNVNTFLQPVTKLANKHLFAHRVFASTDTITALLLIPNRIIWHKRKTCSEQRVFLLCQRKLCFKFAFVSLLRNMFCKSLSVYDEFHVEDEDERRCEFLEILNFWCDFNTFFFLRETFKVFQHISIYIFERRKMVHGTSCPNFSHSSLCRNC